MEELLIIIEQLKENNLALQEYNHKLQAENNQLREGLADVIAQNKLLKAKCIELEDRLNLDSNNSSLPPSRDLYKKKRDRQNKSGRKRGGQPGHKGKNRPLVPLAQVDESSNHYPETRCECGGEILINESNPYRHQVFELPVIKPIIKEYRLHYGKCVCCNKWVRAELPAGVANNIFGIRAMAMVSQLSTSYHLSKRKITKFFTEVFGIKISLGSISNYEGRLSNYLAESYKELEQLLIDQEHLHIDETGHKEVNKRSWMWVFANDIICVFKAGRSRGKKVLKQSLEGFTGKIISDRYGAYNLIDTNRRQLCFAHLIRDFRRFANSKDEEIALIGEELLKKTEEIFIILKKLKLLEITEAEFLQQLKPLKRRIEKLLHIGSLMEDKKQFRRSCKNIFKLKEAMWNFVGSTFGPTNNLAERQLRPYVIWRKLSFGCQSQRGSRFIERTLSVNETCRNLGVNAREFLEDTITANLLGIQAPQFAHLLNTALSR